MSPFAVYLLRVVDIAIKVPGPPGVCQICLTFQRNILENPVLEILT